MGGGRGRKKKSSIGRRTKENSLLRSSGRSREEAEAPSRASNYVGFSRFPKVLCFWRNRGLQGEGEGDCRCGPETRVVDLS